MQFSNQELLSKKKELILKTDKIKKPFEFKIYCYFHSIPICFYTDSLEEQKHLNKIIPPQWLRNELIKNSFHVHIYNPNEFNFLYDDFEDEASQDCFIDLDGKLCIQRDFCAIESSQYEIKLMTNLKHSDGIHNFLRWFLPRKLMKENILVFHSSCVITKNGDALLFLGHSGAGKTTITTLAQDRTPLGDDMNLISIKKNKFYVQAGAIGGTTNHTKIIENTYPLKKIFWLKQAKKTQTNLIKPAIATTKFLSSMANLFWDELSRDEINNLMKFAVKMTESLPLYELEFQKNQELWKHVE